MSDEPVFQPPSEACHHEYHTSVSAHSTTLCVPEEPCRPAIEGSHTALMFRVDMEHHQPQWSRNSAKSFLKDALCEVPRMSVIDILRLISIVSSNLHLELCASNPRETTPSPMLPGVEFTESEELRRYYWK